MKKNWFIFLLLLINVPLLAQLEKDSLYFNSKNYSTKLLNNNFDKQLNTYNFSTHLKYFFTVDNFFIGLKENFNSTIIKVTDKNIKDEQYFWLFGQYTASDKIKLGLLLNNNFYSDDRRLAINKVSTFNSSFFIKFIPTNKFGITPFAGFSNNNQIGERDKGFIYGTEANLDKYIIGDFELSSLIKFQNEDISPRKNAFRLISVNLGSTFEESFNNNISAFYAHQKKDFYFSADQATSEEFGITNNLQSRYETNYSLQDKIKFLPINSPFTIDIQGRVAWRDIERSTRYISLKNISGSAFDTRIQEFRIDFSSSAEYKIEDFNLSFRFNFAEREEKHQPRKIEGLSPIIFNEREKSEVQKNNTSQLATISLLGNIDLTKKDRLIISIFHRKLKYDTPSELNFDDRDELLSMGRILFEHKFNPFFKAFVNFEGNFNKIVYIFAERSSNNNIKRILKFSSGGVVTLGKLISSNSAEVSANYTVFDYEELNPNYRSYSFRQFVYRDSTTLPISNNIKLFLTGYIKLSEQGDFKWSNFTSKPLRYLNEQYVEPKIFYDFYGFSLGVGVRYFSLTNYNIIRGSQKVKASEYISLGPVSEISYELTENINFKMYGWYEFIRSDNNHREMSNFNLKLLYRF